MNLTEEHTKLFTVDGQQVSATIDRHHESGYSVILQRWCSDEQNKVSAIIAFGVDKSDGLAATDFFGELSVENIDLVSKWVGLFDG